MRTIYRNGAVYTGELPLCRAFVVEDGRFICAGSDEDALAMKEPGDEVKDLKGRFVCAGFNDSHMHLLNYGNALGAADLSQHTQSLSGMKEYMKEFIREQSPKPGTWVRGRGWNHDYFEDERRFPNRRDLDMISTEHPICLTRTCGHACVVNTMALRLAGITGNTPQVEGGLYEVDESGEPNGIFRENAMDLIYGCLPEPAKEDIKEMILAASKALNRYGVTSSQTDDLLAFNNVPYERVLEAYRELDAEGRMTVRVYEQSQFTTLDGLKAFVEKGYNTGWGNHWFKIGPLKMLGDGSLGARSAYLSQPYTDDGSTRGIPIFTRQQFEDMVEYADSQGMQVAIHAIGDGILDDILAAYEKALARHPGKDHRHGIVHCQITRPDQLDKFAKLSLHAYFQSIFLDYDIHIVEERIGKERAASSYHFRTLYETTHASNGSDCPVELPDVMKGIQCAVTRTTVKDHVGPYLPEQALDIKQALDSFTAEGAYASFEENVKGRIAPGMLADFVILGANPFETSPEELAGIPVEATYVDGVCRYSREAEGKQQQEKQKKGFYFMVKCYILFNSTGIPVQNWKVLYQGNPGGIPC